MGNRHLSKCKQAYLYIFLLSSLWISFIIS